LNGRLVLRRRENTLELLAALVFIAVFSLLPIYVGHRIGEPKGRMGWLWGLLLGWIGVIIVAVLPPSTRRSTAPETM
jgi:hypothetical protein